MGPSIRSCSIVVFVCMLLTGCKINVSVLGEGQISVLTPDIASCASAPGDLCLNAGYNQAVELRAIPARGYVFVGWSGACSGVATCTLHSLGDRHVVAVFRTEDTFGFPMIPAMRNLDDFFFSGPWPSDLRRRNNGTLDFTDYPVGNGLLAKSARAEASRQTGFARNGSLYIPLLNRFEQSLDNESVAFYYSDIIPSYLQLVNLSPDSPHYLERIPVQSTLHTSDNVKSTSLLQIIPKTGYVLDANTTYGMVLFAGSPWIIKSRHMQDIIDNGANGLQGEHWNRIRAFVNEHTTFTANEVAAFSVFTTQPENPDYPAIKKFVDDQQHSRYATTYRTDVTTAYDCSDNNPFSRHTRLREYRIHLPYVLTGKPPYLLTGGRLSKNAEDHIVAGANPIETRMIITLPCTASDADSPVPVEIHALPTDYEFEEYWGEYLSLTERREPDQNVIRVFVAAPHTLGRTYLMGYQSLNLITELTGSEPEELAVFLGDFNPFNIAAIEPQYMQYAMEILYVKSALKQMALWGQEEQQWLDEYGASFLPHYADFSNAHPNLDNITLVGTSLGGLSALHANAIDPTHTNLILNYMPRPNAWHINDVWEYLDSWLSESAKDALAKLLGVEFPVAAGDPLLGLVQTAIDSVDPANLVSATRDQNTLLVLAEYANTLHGGHAAYSIASVFEQQVGISARWSSDWEGIDYPIERYLENALRPVEIPVTGTPLRVVIPQWNEEWSLLSFSTQVQSGEGFRWQK